MTRIIVVGAGIIGAALAYNLARRGASVSLVEVGAPAGEASGRSFGWINASFSLNAEHFRLRAAGMEAWRRLSTDLDGLGLTWPGCLWFEALGADLARFGNVLADHGYPCRPLERREIARLEPALSNPPEEGLLLPTEGAVDLPTAVGRLLAAAADRGATVWSGIGAKRLVRQGDRVTGVETHFGVIEADLVVLAAGTATPGLLEGQGMCLPMLSRPGLIVRTIPAPKLISHILATPGQEIRQLADGTILAPASANHQADGSERLTDAPEELAKAALARVRALLPGIELRIGQAQYAERPVPGDGLPVIGPGPVQGLYLAVMHSGATLAAVAGEYAAEEIMAGARQTELATFRPDRFA